MRKRSLGVFPVLWVGMVLILSGCRTLYAAQAMVPVQLERVMLVNDQPAVLLANESEHAYLVVYIDAFMAQSIQMGLLGLTIERPLTHDLIGILLHRLGAKLSKVSITELRNDTYYALLSLRVNGSLQEIDARPSDALAIAVRTHTPIFVARSLMSDRLFPEESPGDIHPAAPAGRKQGA